MVKVSIIIPVYNSATHLDRSLSSVLRQTCRELEVIAIDDGSSDDSLAVLRAGAARDARVRVLSQANAGVSVARNVGLEAAVGAYVFFHDADDELEPDAIEHLLKVAAATGSDVVGGVFRRHTDRRVGAVEAFLRDDRCMDFRRDAALAELHCSNFSCCNKLFNLSFLRRVGLYFTPGLYMQDIEFWIKVMFTSANITQCDKIVSNYFYFADSSSHSRTHWRYESLFVVYERLHDFFDANQLGHLAYVGRLALMQGAFPFFTRWKLEEWERSRDANGLVRLSALLQRIPDEDFVRFFERRRSSTAPILLLVRSGEFAQAARLRESPYAGPVAWQPLLRRLDDVPKILRYSRAVGISTVQKLSYDLYFLLKRYRQRPARFLHVPADLYRRLKFGARRD